MFVLMARRAAAIVVCALLAFVAPSVPASGPAFSDQYDDLIERTSRRYIPKLDAAFGWQLWKAQLFQESRLAPEAVSPVGAKGLPQIMPATWKEQVRLMDLPEHATAFMPRYAVPAGAHYMGRMVSIWTSPRPAVDLAKLSQASYNAGAGNIIKAQRAAGGAVKACPVMAHLHEVTGHHAEETRTYLERISRYYRQMRAQ